jgi:hypothetical protein
MSLTDKDFQDLRLCRPASAVDIWDLDDRIDRLEAIAERLERAVAAFGELYKGERIKNWELILREMLKREENKRGHDNGTRSFRVGAKSPDTR